MDLEKTSKPEKSNISGLILAGGQGKRFNGQDKGRIIFNNIPLVEHAIHRLTPQVSHILISANRHLDYYQQLDAHCIKDIFSDYPGPLAGIHAALQNIQTDWLVSIACDSPCFPDDYVIRLSTALCQSDSLIAVAQSNQRLQNVFMLLHKSLFGSLERFLKTGERKAQIWIEQHNPVIVDFKESPDAFYNINTPEDLMQIEKFNCNE